MLKHVNKYIEIDSREKENDSEILEATGKAELEKILENNRSLVMKTLRDKLGSEKEMELRQEFAHKQGIYMDNSLKDIEGVVPLYDQPSPISK